MQIQESTPTTEFSPATNNNLNTLSNFFGRAVKLGETHEPIIKKVGAVVLIVLLAITSYLCVRKVRQRHANSINSTPIEKKTHPTTSIPLPTPAPTQTPKQESDIFTHQTKDTSSDKVKDQVEASTTPTKEALIIETQLKIAEIARKLASTTRLRKEAEKDQNRNPGLGSTTDTSILKRITKAKTLEQQEQTHLRAAQNELQELLKT